MDCSTIIVSYNTFAMTCEAVRTALAAAPGLETEVIVIDNNSPDQSGPRLREAFPAADYPNVHIRCNTDNPGFAAANNQGAELARGAILFFLNPDTVVHDDAIRVLCDFLHAHAEVAAVGPHVLNADGTDQPSTFDFVTARGLLHHYLPLGALLMGADAREDPVPIQTSHVDVVKGCALAIRREVFDELGGWDASYFMYAEETELCYGAAQAGYVNYFVREAVITHYGGASSIDYYAQQQIVHQRSVLHFLKRHHGTELLLLNRLLGTVGFGARALLFPMLKAVRPHNREAYQRRGEAASTLFRWFLLDYS